MFARHALVLLALTAALALAAGGCAREHAPAAPRARVLAAGLQGDPLLEAAGPEAIARVIHAGGAPVTVVNVWATWCGPCREEFPALLDVVRAHPDVRLVLVSADFPEQASEAKAFLARHGVSGTTWLKDGADQAFIDTVDRRWSGALPATLVLDAKGNTAAFWEGAADAKRFEAAIDAARRNHP